jgi:murein DD-endopeptidase MepM/ murein hydrolase activator NlpD
VPRRRAARRLLIAALAALAGLGLVGSAGSALAGGSSARSGDGVVRTAGGQVQSAYGDAPVSTVHFVVPMAFPVVGKVSYSDSFLACRDGCTRRHFGQDLMGHKMEPLIAAFDGTVTDLQRETSVGQGNYLSIRSRDRVWTVNYLHVNNDAPGTDDGKGTLNNAFLPGLHVGSPVVRGQLVGWLGDSGNAESAGAHLHFELRHGDAWSGTVYNPLYSINAAPRYSAAVVAAPHQPGELLRWSATGPVYLLMADGSRRTVPPSMMAVYGWTAADVVRVTGGEMAVYPFTGTAPLRNGSVVSAPDGVRWATTGNRRYAVSDSQLASMGLTSTGAVAVTADALLGTPVATGGVPGGAWRDGAFVKAFDDAQVWIIDRGARRPLSMGAFGWWGVPPGQIAVVSALPTTPPAGPVVGYKDGTVFHATAGWFMVVAGIRRPIKDVRALTYYNWISKRSFYLYDNVTAALPLGPPIA